MDFVNRSLFREGEQISTHNSLMNSYKNIAESTPSPLNQPPIDMWIPEPQDRIFTHIRGAVIAPVHKLFGMDDNDPANIMIDRMRE